MSNISERYPSCVHSATHHNTMSISDQSHPGSSSCSCEDCSRYKLPTQTEQSSNTYEILQQQANAIGRNTSNEMNDIATSATSPPTTYLARRVSTSNTVASPKMMPAGFGLGGDSSPGHMYHQRRASLEFNNRERSFQQHSTACDCRGSGVGCGCSFTCSC
ncbi:hypothetical protein BGZ76_003027 [Entomortierella beljakovae]|nr:hypothetical protein BGZ76_003027 [Entomortierella beljakovae]